MKLKDDTKQKGFFKIIWRLLSIFIGLRVTVPGSICGNQGRSKEPRVYRRSDAEDSRHADILTEKLD